MLRRADALLSAFVTRQLRPTRTAAAWFGSGLLVSLLVHYAGLRSGFGGLGSLHRASREASGLRISDHIQVLGEVQPIGFLEDLLAVGVPALFVLFLTSAVHELRRRDPDRDDGLPSRLWLVALVGLRRPRRVVSAIWSRTGAAPKRFAFLDLAWPVWLATNVTVRIGDHVSAGAQTIAQLQTGTWLEAMAEVGFLATGLFLLLIAGSIYVECQTRPSRLDSLYAAGRPAFIAVLTAPLVLAPLAAADLRRTYNTHASGPSLTELRNRVLVDRLWTTRERAAAMGHADALSKVDSGRLRKADLAGLRRVGHGRMQRDLAGVRPVSDPRDPNRLVATINTFGSADWDKTAPGRASALVVLARASARGNWKFVFEAPFATWPWPWSDMTEDPGGTWMTPRPTEALAQAFATKHAGSVDHVDVAARVRLVHDRELICGSAHAGRHGRLLVQACVATAAGASPVVLGSNISRRA